MPARKGNKYALHNTGGRPPLYKTPDEMAIAINAYFEWCKGEIGTQMQNVINPETKQAELKQVEYWIRRPERPRRCALVLHMGFHTLQAFDHYEAKEGETGKEFSRLIEHARLRIQDAYEQRLENRDTTRGALFVLQNMGWGARTEISYLGKDGKPVDPPSTSVITNVPINATLPNTDKEI